MSRASMLESDKEPASPRNARMGLLLFAVYLALYGGFVGVSAFLPWLMEVRVLAGINLAIAYGIGLIVAALLLALLYGWLCRRTPEADRKESL
jgi:uncharacterized membrane protein (DUF485 family)